MSYVDRNLTAGEVVIYRTRLHWIVMAHHIVIAALSVVAASALLYYASTQDNQAPQTIPALQIVAGLLFVAAAAAIVIGAARRNATEMAVTNHRVIIKVGLVGRRTVEMLLSKVESIEVKESAMGRMLGYGTIVVIGTGGTPEPFYRVAHPLEFRSKVQQQIEALSQAPRQI